VVIADPRMVRKHYGRMFWESLPPAKPLIASGEEVVEQVASFLSGVFPGESPPAVPLQEE
jgi:ATP-dependent DNA helicase DinG